MEQPEVGKELTQLLQISPIYYDLDKSDIRADAAYRDWETDRKSTRLNSSHSRASRMPSSA